MRSHTGGFMTMGTDRAYDQSIKKKLNTKSSTMFDIFGVDDVLTQVIWNRCFLKKQVYNIHNSISIKIIRATSNWRRMAGNQVERGLATSISGIISSLIGSQNRKHL